MDAYIEILGAMTKWQCELTDSDLREIGEFTRENVLRWMESHNGADWWTTLPLVDFHAVCGDIDIPWATEEARLCFMADCQPFFDREREKLREKAMKRALYLKTLVVGQDVNLISGIYNGKGKVTKVTPSGLELGLLRSDNDGKECNGKGTFEGGPWYIDHLTFNERLDLLNQIAPGIDSLAPRIAQPKAHASTNRNNDVTAVSEAFPLDEPGFYTKTQV